MTQTLPTDRNGNLYYGPKTVAEAVQVIEDARNDAAAYDDNDFSLAAEAARVVDMMTGAGYSNAAARVRNQYR